MSSGESSGSGQRLEQLYDRAYYLHDCEGHREYHRSGGRRLSRRLAKCLGLIEIRPGQHLVDVGCGRGEVAARAAAVGAHVVALDPSRAALELVLEQRERGVDPGRLDVVKGRGEEIPLVDGWADCILLSDVVEHLAPPSSSRLLGECHRVLSPGSRLIVHTQPNRTLVNVTVPILSRISSCWGVTLPADLRSEMSPGSGPEYHPNELSRRQLRRALRRQGFEIDELWLEGSYPLHRVFGESWLKRWLLPRFRRNGFLKNLFASQIFAVAHKAP